MNFKKLPKNAYINKEYILDRGETITIAGIRSPYILKNISDEKFILFSEEEAFIWTTLKENHTTNNLILKYYKTYQSLPWNLLEDIFLNWNKKDLIIFNKTKAKTNNNNFLSKVFNLRNLTINLNILVKFINFIYKNFFKYFLNKYFFVFFFTISIIGNIYILKDIFIDKDNLSIDKHSSFLVFIIIIFLSLISLLIHEMAHGLMLNKFHIRVKRAGFKLYNFIPLFFVDVTESLLLSKRKRIIITLAGVSSNFLASGISIIVYSLISKGIFKSFIGYFAYINLTNFVINLIPFIQLDGYYLLNDITNTNNIIKQSQLIIKKIINEHSLKKKDLLYSLFGILNYIFIFIFIILTIKLILNIF